MLSLDCLQPLQQTESEFKTMAKKKKRVEGLDTLSRKDVAFGRDQTTHGETRQRDVRDVQNERASVKNPVVAWYFVYDLRQCHCNPLLVVLGNQGHAFRTCMVNSASPYTHRRE